MVAFPNIFWHFHGNTGNALKQTDAALILRPRFASSLPWFLEGYVHAFINPLHVFVTCYLSTTWVLPQTI